MTANQWKLLEVLEHWSGHGTIEVCLQFGEYDAASDAKGWSITCLVVGRLMKSLVRRGLATDHDSYDITDKGLELLKKRRERRAASG